MVMGRLLPHLNNYPIYLIVCVLVKMMNRKKKTGQCKTKQEELGKRATP